MSFVGGIAQGIRFGLAAQAAIRPTLPAGYAYWIDDDGSYFVDDDGAYILLEVPTGALTAWPSGGFLTAWPDTPEILSEWSAS